jgi:hypothetical protein
MKISSPFFFQHGWEIRSKSMWQWCINRTNDFLDIIHLHDFIYWVQLRNVLPEGADRAQSLKFSGDWMKWLNSGFRGEEMKPGFTQFVSVFPVTVTAEFYYFNGVSHDARKAGLDLGYDPCPVTDDTVFSLCGVFGYCYLLVFQLGISNVF